MKVLLFFFLFILSLTEASAQSGQPEKRMLVAGNDSLPYTLLSPLHADSTSRYPLIVFLHGAGARGNDNEAPLNKLPALFKDSVNRKNFPAYILVPQCGKSDSWVSFPDFPESLSATDTPTKAARLTLELIHELLLTGNIDSNRIYLTGYSLGGEGTFDLIAREPSLFACAVPVCAVADTANAQRIKNIPVWIFHGSDDSVNSVVYSRMMVKALQNAGGDPVYTEYTGVKHNSWLNAYAEPDLLYWMFEKQRRNKIAVPPIYHYPRSAGKLKNIFSVGIGAQAGFIFAHTQAVLNTKGSYPFGIEGILSWQRNDDPVWELCNCYPRKGLLLSYYDYDTRILGRGYTAAYFLEPMYKLGKRVFFSFRASAGLSWLTNPYDSISNPQNQSYSRHINAYLLFGLGTWYKLSDNLWVNASVNYQHESNGGSREPNKGINWPTAGFTVSYQKHSRPFHTGSRSREKFRAVIPIRFDLGIFATATRSLDANGRSTQWPLLGISMQAAKQIGRLSGVIAAVEVYRDESLYRKLKRFAVDASPVKAGISAGHEFILGKFLFSQRLGIYIFDQTPYYDLLFHRWGLHYRLGKHLGIGFSLQAHRHIADFMDLRVNYTFQKAGNK